MDDPTSEAPELRRTMYIAALWFAAALLSGTVTTALLLASGWRPYRLGIFTEIVWGTGAVLATIGTILLAWAGCPVTEDAIGKEDKRKTWAVRLGIGAFIVGTAIATVVELCSPVSLTVR